MIALAWTHRARRLASAVAAGFVAGRATIQGKIWTAFATTALITGALGMFAAVGTDRAGTLVEKTYDQSLMSINYARAASADFAAMEAAVLRHALLNDHEHDHAKLDALVRGLDVSLTQDLSIAAARAQSERAAAAAGRALIASQHWRAERDARGGHPDAEGWQVLEEQAAKVRQEIELLINYTAGDGFLYRQTARKIVAQDKELNLLGTGAAVLLSSLTAFFLVRRIRGAIAVASTLAERIASGDLDGNLPTRSKDELGTLIAAMGAMRDRIREMMQREVAQRQSAQARLADALEGSLAGVVVADADSRIALINSQAIDFFKNSAVPPRPGVSVDRLTGPMSWAIGAAASHSNEIALPDGRFVRVTRNPTQDGGFIAVFSDISEIKLQKQQLIDINQNLDAALANMSQGLCMYDAAGLLRVANGRFAEIFGLSSEKECIGLAVTDVIEVLSASHVGSPELIAEAIDVRLQPPAETRFLQLTDGRIIAVCHRTLPDGGWVATYEDVTERKHAEEKVAFLARHDSLTGLPNRVLLADRVQNLRAQLSRGLGFSLLCLDLDRFKEVNDTMGHPAGDELLCEVGRRLVDCVREVDTVCRLGGDEFAIAQWGISRPEQASQLAERIIQALSQPFILHGRMVEIGASVGISMAPVDGADFGKLLRSADAALYAVKQGGGGAWQFFDAEMEHKQQARRALEADLRNALDRDQFELHFQPLYDLHRNEVSGAEALLRWRHPERGFVSPADFIPCCEDTGLIIPIGAFVLEKACQEAANWPTPVKVAVNVSPVQFRSPDLVGTVRNALAVSGLPAARLELEITETILLGASDAVIETLTQLRALGCRISMDDFGTGYSSLSYLRAFSFDKIKIDRSFIRDLTEPNSSALIVKTILGLAAGLKVRVTAEGVETLEQFAWLIENGCDEVQGFFLSRPVPAPEFAAGLFAWQGQWAGGSSQIAAAG